MLVSFFLAVTAKAQTLPYSLYQQRANFWVDRYFKGNFDREEFDREIKEIQDLQSLLSAIHARFFEYSLAQLKSYQTDAGKKIMKLYLQRYGEDARPLFKITGHLQALTPTALQAGFHRGNGSIFMDPFRIPPEQWMLIFTHELIHALDDRMYSAIEIFGDQIKSRKLLIESQSGVSLSNLSSDVQKFLWKWVEAGLDRGLFAEYRAWVVTGIIYRQQVDSSVWPKIDWFEKVINGAKNSRDLERNIYQYLDAGSQNPTEEPFTYPAVISAIETLRENSRTQLPSLWNFKTFE